MIDDIMTSRGFRRFASGTNRLVYNYLEDTSFLAKIALDRVGLSDSHAEFRNQNYFKPFCCKIFEVDPTGVIGFVERVTPITSIEEFAAMANDIYILMKDKILTNHITSDLDSKHFMNFGIRDGFGPVIIDYPYAYELDPTKLRCKNFIRYNGSPIPNSICGGFIDYVGSMEYLHCERCGKIYTAKEMAVDKNTPYFYYKEQRKGSKTMGARIVDSEGNVIRYIGGSSDTYITKKDMEGKNRLNEKNIIPVKDVKFKKSHKKSVINMCDKMVKKQNTDMYLANMRAANNTTPFNPVLQQDGTNDNGKTYVKVSKVIDKSSNRVIYDHTKKQKHEEKSKEPEEIKEIPNEVTTPEETETEAVNTEVETTEEVTLSDIFKDDTEEVNYDDYEPEEVEEEYMSEEEKDYYDKLDRDLEYNKKNKKFKPDLDEY